MSAARKFRRYPFIVMIVLAITLTWLVLNGLAANEEATPGSTAAISSIPAAASGGSGQIPAHAAPDVVLVGYYADGGSSRQLLQVTINNTLSDLPVQKVEPLFAGPVERSAAAADVGREEISIYRLGLTPGSDVAAVIRKLNNKPAIAFAEPDYLAQIIRTPNDPQYATQWGLAKVKAPGAWDVTTGSTGVVIAVIDSGMDMDHPDLAGKLWINPGEFAGNGVDDDNNGYVDDIHGWNIVDNNADLIDNTGHGTEVAGIAAAASDNSSGIAGMCWNCQIMVVKVTQAGGVANYSDIAAGIHYAEQKGAHVINLSLGGYSDSTTLRTALADAAETAVIIGGAGNDNDSTPFYPAAYDEYVLAVAGTTDSDTKVNTSNYGSWVDVAAPGEVIVTTFDGGVYGSSSGTSLAAPFAAGLAGLLRSAHTGWSPDMVRAQIVQTTDGIDSLNPGYENNLGSGRLNAQLALGTAAKPDLNVVSVAVDGEANGRPEPGTTVDVDISLFNEWADAANVRATLSSTDGDVTIVTGTADYGAIDAYRSGTNGSSYRITVSGGAPYAHELNLSLNVAADGGYARTIPVTITTASGTEYVSGLISTNSTWSSDKQYIINGNILVQPGVTLTIEPGTMVKVNEGNVLRVDGNLVAQGTESGRITLTSNRTEPTKGDWKGIEAGISGIINLMYCEISYADLAISLWGDEVTSPEGNIDNCYIHHNNVGIGGYGTRSVTENRIVYNELGIGNIRNNAKIDHNEIAYNSLDGIQPGQIGTLSRNSIHHNRKDMEPDSGYGIVFAGGTVISNSILYNDYGVGPIDYDSQNLNFYHNNLLNNTQYDVYNTFHSFHLDMNIPNNWWGTTDTGLIDQHIYDFLDDFGLGTVTYKPLLSAPVADAPGYLHDLAISPADPIGIETATFDLTFSRPMDQGESPELSFEHPLNGTVQKYNVENSDIASNDVTAIGIDSANSIWYGHYAGEVSVLGADGSWRLYNSTNSSLTSEYDVWDIAEDAVGNIWICNSGLAILHPNGSWSHIQTFELHDTFDGCSVITPDSLGNVWIATGSVVTKIYADGSWDRYDLNDDGPKSNGARSITLDRFGNVWFGTYTGGVKVLRIDNSWQSYTSSNSGLADDEVTDIAIDAHDNKWITHLNEGVSVLRSDGSWQVFTAADNGLASDMVYDAAVDASNNKWFATDQGVSVLHSDGSWLTYDIGISASFYVSEIAHEPRGDYWFGVNGQGAGVLYSRESYAIFDNAQWLDDAHWRATYDITSLVPRGDCVVNVSGAKGTDGMAIPPDSRFGFKVDYAGEISDQTAPPPPSVIAGGEEGDASKVIASWRANDPDSTITGYRYAIGSAAGATDIVNWTITTKSAVTRSGLGLVEGRQYWLSVQARNSGGLWSATGHRAFVSGQPYEPPLIFLPVICAFWQ